MRNKLILLLILVCGLTACNDEVHYAPVTDIATIEHIPKSGVYHVAAGETLYSIAWRYGLDYRYLATLNHIPPPYHVVAGQRLDLSNKPKPATASAMQPIVHHPVATHIAPVTPAHYFVERDSNTPVAIWRWPARGPILGTYSALNKGINIGGTMGQPIYATAAGQVVYSGSGLRGYGNLIIIKHNTHYLTAYAHNNAVLVKEGDRVRAGQQIAKMGLLLHFEIRRNGQPVNPLNYLASS